MAGKRRDKGKPTRRTLRLTWRKRRLNDQLAATPDPADRVAIAADHYRSALRVSPDAAGAEQVVELLVDAGDRLYQQAGRSGRDVHAQ